MRGCVLNYIGLNYHDRAPDTVLVLLCSGVLRDVAPQRESIHLFVFGGFSFEVRPGVLAEPRWFPLFLRMME